MTRLRPRFSLRTLAIFVAVVCAYFGVWEVTKKYGVSQIVADAKTSNAVVSCTSPVPCIIRLEAKAYMTIPKAAPQQGTDEITITINKFGVIGSEEPDVFASRCYYVWLFGQSYKLPYQTYFYPAISASSP